MCVSSIIVVEFYYGVEKSEYFERNFVVIEDFLLCFIILDY